MGNLPAAPPPPTHTSILPPPALLALPWLIPFRPPSHLPPPPSLTPWLPGSVWRWHGEGAGGTQTATQMGNGQRKGCLPTPAPCWHGAQARRRRRAQKHRCASSAELSPRVLFHSATYRRALARANTPTSCYTCWCTRPRCGRRLPPTLSLSVTDVYTLISSCTSTCALQKFFARLHHHKHIERHHHTSRATDRCIYSRTPTRSHFSATSTETHFTINHIASRCAVTWSYIAGIQ